MNGSTPRSSRRKRAVTASFECTVEKTMWPGVGRLAGDRRRLLIADFADHDDVGVLAENRSQAGGESLPGLGVDLHLGDVVELVLDRVFDRDDVLLVAVDLAKRRRRAWSICRRRSGRSRGTCRAAG